MLDQAAFRFQFSNMGRITVFLYWQRWNVGWNETAGAAPPILQTPLQRNRKEKGKKKHFAENLAEK